MYSPVACICLYLRIVLWSFETLQQLQGSWGLYFTTELCENPPRLCLRVVQTGVFVLNIPKAFQSSIVFKQLKCLQKMLLAQSQQQSDFIDSLIFFLYVSFIAA